LNNEALVHCAQTLKFSAAIAKFSALAASIDLLSSVYNQLLCLHQ